MTIMLYDPKSHEFEKKKLTRRRQLTQKCLHRISRVLAGRKLTPLEGNTYVQLSQKLSDTDFRNHYL